MTQEQKDKSRYTRLNVFILEQLLYVRKNRVDKYSASVFFVIMRTAKREKLNLKKRISLLYGTQKAVQGYSRNDEVY